MRNNLPPNIRIGLALGSGSARGMAHIGVIRALQKYNLQPDIICGSSVGALMGAAAAHGCLDKIATWLSEMSTLDLVRYLDISLLSGSGVADGERLLQFLRAEFGDPNIEDLALPFAAVATELQTGREVWLQQGSVWDAARASMALPGMLTPVLKDGRWLVDGGLVNPVPVSVCRALGADVIIAVNLNSDLVSRQFALHQNPSATDQPEDITPAPVLTEGTANNETQNLFAKLSVSIKERASPLIEQWMSPSEETPGLFGVVASSINIMQDRITRSRLAGEPADIVLTPRLNDVGMLEFSRAKDVIKEGEQCVARMHSLIEHRLGRSTQRDA
ncbi:MAG: patatin-like phospholipase family protein [Pseudomonadales bacterium]